MGRSPRETLRAGGPAIPARPLAVSRDPHGPPGAASIAGRPAGGARRRGDHRLDPGHPPRHRGRGLSALQAPVGRAARPSAAPATAGPAPGSQRRGGRVPRGRPTLVTAAGARRVRAARAATGARPRSGARARRGAQSRRSPSTAASSVALGTSDGRVMPLEMKFDRRLPRAGAAIEPDAVFGDPIVVDTSGRPILRLAMAAPPSGPVTVAQVGPTELIVQTRRREEGARRPRPSGRGTAEPARERRRGGDRAGPRWAR